ncbi:MAG TPA: hypothetical protein VMB02_06960 [Candidatus Aquilonibacter sp.]|nr:hypothetical protein [Candidatus Aquilonibacter sp.]
MPRWARILIILGSLSLGTAVYLYFFGFQTLSALLGRYEFRRMPSIAEVPVALADVSISAAPHTKISYFGYELELPWDDVDDAKCKTAGTIRVTVFRSGNAFWFSTFPPKSLVNEIMKDSHLDPERFRLIYGDEAFESDYGFYKEMLQTTPSQITPFVSERQAATGTMLLSFKAIAMPRAESGIFAIETPSFRGFQFENPRSRPPRVTDELYSSDGGIDLIFFQKTVGSAPAISQAEINRVIQSVHKIPAQPAPVHPPQ